MSGYGEDRGKAGTLLTPTVMETRFRGGGSKGGVSLYNG
jgi:hypothetical protein